MTAVQCCIKAKKPGARTVDVMFKITFDNSRTNQVNKICLDFVKKIASLQHLVLRNEMTHELFFLVISMLNPSRAQTIYLC